jgi:hypothetical protein
MCIEAVENNVTFAEQRNLVCILKEGKHTLNKKLNFWASLKNMPGHGGQKNYCILCLISCNAKPIKAISL